MFKFWLLCHSVRSLGVGFVGEACRLVVGDSLICCCVVVFIIILFLLFIILSIINYIITTC